ncbi:hypothetical protein [Dermacoccus nishinomiyaensis]|uniref:hypothetical protein n=1 Tax=Dermacoccus nishinomiyaensis TaxID=1274 RepID=UPI000939CBDC|nr:hypothetical protein [Dermacoccus nishinomiyaensis]
MTRKLTPAQLDEIEAAATEASSVHGRGWHSEVSLERDTRGRIPAWHRDAKLIAMMDPAATLALVAEVRELRAKVERVRELHNADGERMTGSPRATGWEDYCTHCQRAAPCPTVRALDLFKALGEEA